MIDFKKSLNDEQYAAVTASDGPILVLAAAGTGKTRTLVHRVAYLVEQGISPERILLLTFTNRAAHEMLDRSKELGGERVSGVWGGTFHHMANRILRRDAQRIGYGNGFAILDREDSRSIVSHSMKARSLKSREFPKPDVLLAIFSTCANTEKTLDDMLADRFAEYAIYREDILKVEEDYRSKKKAMDAMDFDDLLVQCLRLLREHPPVLERYQEQFQHVLVDEYQDTNVLQAEIVDKLAARNKNLMVVGDDFQSIYSWRGANFRNILTFPERYADSKTFILETNYRSVPEILQVANTCIAGNPGQFQKTLRATRAAHKKPVVARMRDGMEQAHYVVETIRHALRSGYKPQEIAVLYRAHFHAMELQLMMTKERVQYNLTSGVRFFEQAHIKDVCSALRVLVFPEDELSFHRLMELLPGVGPGKATKIWQAMGGSFRPENADCLRVIRAQMKGESAQIWLALEPIFKAYGEENLREDPGEVAHRFTEAFYLRYLADAFQDHERREEDIREMILYMADFETAEGFLSDIALLSNLDAEQEQLGSKEKTAVRLSTVHQAKGLEFPVVILIWMTDNMFPSSRSLNESAEGEAEERRLFYVAVTRAKDELYMCVPEVRRMPDGGVVYCAPSRFVEEVPRELVKQARGGFF